METCCNISPSHLLLVCCGSFVLKLWLSAASTLVFHSECCFQHFDQEELLLAMAMSVIFCLLFSFAAKETWKAMFAPLHCLTSYGRAGVSCGECFRKLQVQCLVRRLHFQAENQVFLPVPITSFPFKSTHHPDMTCTIVNVCASKKKHLGVCFLQERPVQEVVMAMLITLSCFA